MTGGALRPRFAEAYLRRTSTMANHVKIMAVLTARPGKAEDLRALLDGMLAPSRAEPGNLRYDLWQDQADPARFVLDELYAGSEAVAAHRATPHFQSYLSAVNDLAERSALVLDPAAVA
jgi:quinol monooxygenase YgiN